MDAIVQRWGKSLALKIPNAIADQIRITDGSKVKLQVKGASLVVRAASPHYRLADLLKQGHTGKPPQRDRLGPFRR
jgi:antitoxin component of MazEF toxin-antitoxin module